MKTSYLLPHKYKTIGWILFISGLVSGIIMLVSPPIETNAFTFKVLSVYNSDSIFNERSGFFKLIENEILDELIAIAIIIGGLIVGFSKEKIEDEFIYKLRTDSLVWAIIFNYTVLLLSIIFVYEMTFLDILIFHMFTPLVFFVCRFNFLKLKSQSNDE